MQTTAAVRNAFFDAVRKDDVPTAQRLVADEPELAHARWSGRAGDGKMRSLGPSPFNRHTWLAVPDAHAADDPRFTSTPLIYTRPTAIVRRGVARWTVDQDGTVHLAP